MRGVKITDNTVNELLEAARKKLADCRSVGDCSDGALLPHECCSNECAELWDAVLKADSEKASYSLDNPPFDTLHEPIWVSDLNDVAVKIKARHPRNRSVSIKVVKAKLTIIMRDTPCKERCGLLWLINKQHEQWCKSADWTKDGGAFAKSLEAWLNPKARLWENEPRPVAAKPEYVDRYALEGGV